MPSILHNDTELRDPVDFIPLSPLDFELLLLLSDKALHGYGIVKASADAGGEPSLELGSLYRIIGRMMQGGLIEECPVAQPETKRKRKYYQATALGRGVARAEARRLRALLESKLASRLLEEG